MACSQVGSGESSRLQGINRGWPSGRVPISGPWHGPELPQSTPIESLYRDLREYSLLIPILEDRDRGGMIGQEQLNFRSLILRFVPIIGK